MFISIINTKVYPETCGREKLYFRLNPICSLII
ncbi:hypothetical protein CoNPh17_CDS0111 [Staphylococcus phage S-CoN_Ph17]|nr:hypothetical protein CoNPh17_CDS0111 [Staphylococcus phage S-CoN_Ph17]